MQLCHGLNHQISIIAGGRALSSDGHSSIYQSVANEATDDWKGYDLGRWSHVPALILIHGYSTVVQFFSSGYFRNQEDRKKVQKV